MHQLFQLVLGQRDLSRAGDLFSLDDAEIEDYLSQALEEIKAISCHPDYVNNDNDQAVVEICITRITTAIRETSSMERHGPALVALWESCLEHNLQPQGKDEDTPHSKIASDITSCILQNYNRAPMMALAIPVAMRFLQQGNRELSRNMSSYLSLAAIAKPELLVQHTQAIISSVLEGNSMLLRVLPSVYPLEPDPVHRHIQDLVLMIPELDQTSRQHLLRLLQMISEQQPQALTSVIPSLIGHLSDASLNDALLATLVNTAQISPASFIPVLPDLRIVGQQTPGLLGHVAKIHGSVGLTNTDQAREALQYLVCVLACTEHSVHHTVLLEIHSLTERYTSIIRGGAKDIYRSSNSFSAIARLLGLRLQADTLPSCRQNMEADEDQSLQVKRKAFEEKLDVQEEEKKDSTGSQRCPSLGQVVQDEHQELSFNRSKSLALHTVKSRFNNPDCIQDGDVELLKENYLIEASCFPETCPVASSDQEEHSEHKNLVSNGEGGQMDTVHLQERDRLWKHLRDHLEKIRDFCAEMFTQIPIPEHCIIEDTQQGCVAKLSFSCPIKGHYCLYGKSSFLLCSGQPHLWIHIMLLALQSKADEALSSMDGCVQQLRRLWEKTQLKGAHSFELAMTQTAVPQKKDVDSLQIHLEEVRFFDLFGYSVDQRAWLCFMCNNPEKATEVNQDGQPLIEGMLKEKQVRWKFIKRWKTRYFTLAGNQLLFRKGKSDELDSNTIELSKVQSVKVVARKRRDRSLPRAFEIFADNKTYVLKAEDERNAEEWLQCINVAVAQAKERENRESTTYL
ncbi:ventricular zone-expressed PH domain-containing protein isoform X2 [Silurus meridionalis]|uniref:ventricular zone-expressed PH domain-containing protein isoform X2 n=1 Tax=Silurus meridionalis TaxID=175797 RepID=UPI001EEA987E|nr:ventricular zone-expressed PH domain-containing protein isoform X2 [Silurus meridionalis]